MKTKLIISVLCLFAAVAFGQYQSTSLGISNTIPITSTNSYAETNVLDLTKYTHAAFEFNGSGSNTNTNTLTLTLSKSLNRTNWQAFTNWSITMNGTNRSWGYIDFDFGVFGWARLEAVGSSLTNTVTNANLFGQVKGYRREQ